MKLIWKLNQKFDNIKGINRFIVFMCLVAFPFSLLSVFEPLMALPVAAGLIGMRWWWLNKVRR